MALDSYEEMAAYREGKEAYRENPKSPNSPYEKGSKENEAFLRGWVQGLKASGPAHSFSADGSFRSGERTFAERYRNMPDWTKYYDDDDD
ncbi:hypothetical protein [Marinobacter mangrovi]|uniref:hypothetical protein n=1 Tax=Marinobacter mangrovi TaxID=2803918 RepID=UPI00193490AC|nr:hypothetical protein [Marinobacter mangrovi]